MLRYDVTRGITPRAQRLSSDHHVVCGCKGVTCIRAKTSERQPGADLGQNWGKIGGMPDRELTLKRIGRFMASHRVAEWPVRLSTLSRLARINVIWQ